MGALARAIGLWGYGVMGLWGYGVVAIRHMAIN